MFLFHFYYFEKINHLKNSLKVKISNNYQVTEIEMGKRFMSK